MFEGYIRLGSSGEIVNSERTERYCAHQAPAMPFKARFNTETIHIAAEDPPYESAQVDDAPWFDPANPATADFYGLYPLEVTGVGDSTLTAAVTESIGDGGSVGEAREASRTIRVHGLLVGANRLATETGLSWLREAVKSDECGQADSCGAGDFTYFLDVPDICEKAYGDAETSSVTEMYGSHGAGTVSRQWLVDEVPLEMPIRARWLGTPQQGSHFIYGAKDRFGDTVLEQYGPVSGLRRNYIPNPSFRVDDAQWGQYNGAVMSWVLQDGADGLGYVNVDGSAWVAPPSSDPNTETHDNQPAGMVYGEGVFGEGVYGGDTSGGVPPTEIVGTDVPTITSVLLSPPVGPVTFSVSIRGDGINPVDLFILDVVGNTVASRQVDASSEWERFYLHATISTPIYVAVGTTSTADVDMVLLETGTLESEYFDGASAGASWEGDPNESTSKVGFTGPIEISRDDGDWRPFLTILDGSFDGLGLQWWLHDEIDLATQLEPYQRTFHNVRCTQGVGIINRWETKSGGYFIEVDFLLVAGNPHPYSIPVPVATTPLASTLYTDVQVPAALDDEWLFDPDCLVPTPPPTAPTVEADCIEQVASWQRYYVGVPAQDVALWNATVPTVGINSKGSPISQIRVRVHPNPFGYAPQQVDPLDYCSEFIVSYLPPYTRLALNGMTKRAFASKGGKATVAADHLLYGSSGGPMSWPELSCGVSYLLTIDVPQDASINDFDLDLSVTRRE